jgi:hypothetical protein
MQHQNDTNLPKRVYFRVSSQNMNAATGAIHPYRANTSRPNTPRRNTSRPDPSLPNTSGRVFEHMDAGCLLNNTTLDAAYSLWVNSLRIPTESLDLCVPSANGSVDRPLEVFLGLHCNDKASPQPTAYSLTMKISPTCIKTFEFAAEAKVHIPISTFRPTLVTVKLHQESDDIALQNVLVDKYTQTTAIIPGENFLIQQNNLAQIVYSRLSTDNETINCQFPCYSYQRDVDTRQEEYDMQSLSTDLTRLDNRAVVVPNDKIVFVSGTEALNRVAKLEHHRQQLLDTLDECRRSTVLAELGATEANAAETMKHIDWKRSYCVPSDTHLSQVITLARDMHHMLARSSNMAVYGTWFFQPQLHTDTLAPTPAPTPAPTLSQTLSQNVREAVCSLLTSRSNIATRIAGRRRDLQSVVRVRTSFLLLSAIDDALRSVCATTLGSTQNSTQNSAQKSTNSLFSADNIPCHAYWLGQMRSNTNNSVTMDDECYSEACSVLALCQRVKNSGTVLIPECNTKLSNLTRSVWQNMHLQGLASGDPLVVASVPHFLYKHKQVIDYSNHPFLLFLKKHQTDATEEQVQSTKLLAILVSADVEHRIITSSTHRKVEQLWDLACQKSENALIFLRSLFDPSFQSLITVLTQITSEDLISQLSSLGI